LDGIQLKQVTRHGSRNPTISDIEGFKSLEDLLQAHQDSIPERFSHLRNWKTPFDVRTATHLVARGEKEVWRLGKRVSERYEGLFDGYVISAVNLFNLNADRYLYTLISIAATILLDTSKLP
jgi:hypothetical protein